MNDASAAETADNACRAYTTSINSGFVETRKNGNWEDPDTWGGNIPGAGDRVLVNHSIQVSDARSGEIQIRGELNLAGEFDAYGSVIVCDGGRLTGSEGILAFHVENDRLFSGNARNGPVPGYPDFHPMDIGLWALPGATVNLSGEELTSWMNAKSLNDRFRSWRSGVKRSPAFRNGQAQLATRPVGWSAGDQLLLVNERGESALAVLEAIEGASLTYRQESDQPLSGYVLKPETDAQVDAVYPKIANLSRSLQIISAEVSEEDANHRAHMAFLENSTVTLNHVEIRNLGPRAKLGRYPVHWHHTSSTSGVLNGSSIWQSIDDGSNRFVTLHMANGVEVTNNVAFRSQGHGFFMEELNEQNNIIAGNLSVDVRYGEELPNVEEHISTKTHHYWVRAGNEIRDNVAAGNNWDVSAKGKREPLIDGMVVLPSPVQLPDKVISNFECLGCGGIGMWVAASNVKFESPVSTFAIISGFKGYTVWGIDTGGAVLEDPLFVLNGNNEEFKRSGDYASNLSWASQIFINYGEVSVIGGILAGDVAVHAHYHSRFSFKDVHILTNTFVDPTYWEVSALIENSTIESKNLFRRGYPKNRRASPGLIQVRNSCFRSSCSNSRKLQSITYSSPNFSEFFQESRARSDSSGAYWLEISDTDYQTGFIAVPDDLSATHWSVTPEPIDDTDPFITNIRENQNDWKSDYPQFNGFLDGFPPGTYLVKLYESADRSSLLSTQTVEVSAGKVSQLNPLNTK